MQQRSPAALVLLAHYCILLKRSGDRWWIEGKAEEDWAYFRGEWGGLDAVD